MTKTQGGTLVPSMSLEVMRTLLTGFLAIEHNFSKKMDGCLVVGVTME
jgi:hypothetical protein